MDATKPAKSQTSRAAKQVLITVNRAGLEEWNRFEDYCKRYKVNKSRLIRQLVSNFLKEQAAPSEPITLQAGRFSD